MYSLIYVCVHMLGFCTPSIYVLMLGFCIFRRGLSYELTSLCLRLLGRCNTSNQNTVYTVRQARHIVTACLCVCPSVHLPVFMSITITSVKVFFWSPSFCLFVYVCLFVYFFDLLTSVLRHQSVTVTF